ncbi:hypothetical protein MUO83_07860 [Candidatus Bathyarchaeota archaeon]|nr:hypothetical protein [Candidatus Bathyarchaeota archaeon]
MNEWWKQGIRSLDSEGMAQRKLDYARCKTELRKDPNLEPEERLFLLEQLNKYVAFLRQQIVNGETQKQ